MGVPETFYPVFARTYARYIEKEGRRETWNEVIQRAVNGIEKLIPGNDPQRQKELFEQFHSLKAFPAGRWLWVGGTDWVMQEKNHLGAFNCISIRVDRLQDFATLFDLCCQGCGTGAILEWSNLSQLPPMKNKLNVEVIPYARENIGALNEYAAPERTRIEYLTNQAVTIKIGDSREGWAHGILSLLELAAYGGAGEYSVTVDLNYVRPRGSLIRGFGGVTNPERLPTMYTRIAEIISGAAEDGRRLTPEECCLVIDEGAEAVVAGNVRRSAGMRQFDDAHPNIKLDLYHMDEDGNVTVDPKRQPLRMANHTNVYHELPSVERVKESVRLQFRSGEGAVQYAPAAIARANRDLLPTPENRNEFIRRYQHSQQQAANYLIERSDDPMQSDELDHRMKRYGLNPCAEIIGNNFACNLSEFQLSQIDPFNYYDQYKAIEAATLAACANLHFTFPVEKLEYSRQVDPIIGVGFSGLFDFFARAFGDGWVEWCLEGRPHGGRGDYYRALEADYLEDWSYVINRIVDNYCESHGLRRPNRVTTVKPSGTLSQLSGSSPGWHPSKAAHFLRRITFAAGDPVARACRRYGYRVVPSQKCVDGYGQLLNDPDDPRVDEWLVEIPVKAEWAKWVENTDLDTQEMPAVAQFDLAMQVQKYYCEHNVSSTIEFDEDEIEDLAGAIHNEMWAGNYISFALMQRARPEDLKRTFPRLPYEPMTSFGYQQEVKLAEYYRESESFEALLEDEMKKLTKEEANQDVGEQGCSKDGVCSL